MSDLQARVRYALRAAADLAEHYDGEKPIKVREIAARTAVPANYLVHILLDLKRRALVNSTRGPAGGYWLVRRPGRITVADIVDAVQGNVPGRGGPELDEVPCDRAINDLWREADRKSRQFMASVTLEDLLQQT
jgi:Rrf2 family protein